MRFTGAAGDRLGHPRRAARTWHLHHRVDVAGVAVIEREWQAQVVGYARQLGWRVFHVANSKRSEPGWPDLALVRDRLVMAELKTETGRVSDDQRQWLALLDAAGVEPYLWRPSDVDDVLRVLTHRRRSPTPTEDAA